MFQAGNQACEGNAALWTPWYWENSNGSPDWKNAEREGTKGIQVRRSFGFHICIERILLVCKLEWSVIFCLSLYINLPLVEID